MNRIFTMVVAISLCSFAIDSWAHNKVVVIPLLGDDDSIVYKNIKNVVVVAHESGDFTNPIDAINSINDANSSNPYVIYIAPGRYTLPEGSQLVMKKNIDIVGSGRTTTILDFPILFGQTGGLKEHPNSAFVIGAEGTTISDLTIWGMKNGAYGVGLHYSPAINQPMTVRNVNIIANSIPGGAVGIYTTSKILIENCGISGHATFSEAYGVLNDGGDIEISNSTVTGLGFSSADVSAVYGVFTAENSKTNIVESEVSALTGAVMYGVYNESSSSSVKVRGSTVSGETGSLFASTGTGMNESFISDSFLSEGATGDPKCNFVFTSDGEPLNAECK